MQESMLPYRNTTFMTRALAFLLGLGITLPLSGQQFWTEPMMGSFLTGKGERTWVIKAKKGKAEFAEVMLGAKFTFHKDGKLIVTQGTEPPKNWTWSIARDSQIPIGFKLKINGNGFQPNPVQIPSNPNDRLTITSLDPKIEIPAKVYMVSPKPAR
jgi:hypothetical protein